MNITITDIPLWYSIAATQLGVSEIRGVQDNPRIIEYHATTRLRATEDEVPWCASFVNWCMMRAGIHGTDSARARSWLSWGEARDVDDPPLGAVIVFSRDSAGPTSGHVGFFVWQDADSVCVLGGNQSNKVCVREYPRATVLGVRWPAPQPPMTCV